MKIDDNVFEHAPGANLEYSVDWAASLKTDDTIESSTWDVPDGMELGAVGNTGLVTTAWVSGGTVQQTYDIVNTITSAQGVVDSRLIKLLVRVR